MKENRHKSIDIEQTRRNCWAVNFPCISSEYPMPKYFREDYVYEIIDSPPLYQEIQRIREQSMFSRNINCRQCGHRGSVEIGAISANSTVSIFKYTGHNPDSGDLYFRCPLCKSTLSVEPMNMISSDTVDGLPGAYNVPITADKKEKSLLPLWTVLSVGFFLGLMIIIVNHFFIRG